MQAQARLAHDIVEAVRVGAVETTEARIMRALDEQAFAEDATHIVRPLCSLATMFLAGVRRSQPVIWVPCPNDELRRAQTHPSLLVGGADQISLFPLSEEVYAAFAQHMEMMGRGFGEYTLFTRSPRGGWDVQEFG